MLFPIYLEPRRVSSYMPIVEAASCDLLVSLNGYWNLRQNMNRPTRVGKGHRCVAHHSSRAEINKFRN